MLSKHGLLQDMIRGGQAFCEQIICLYRKPEQRDWWHELLGGPYEDVRASLFAPEGRITAASMAEIADKAKEAVDAGYRPVFFVPDAAAWPPVYEALGHYQGFAQLYIYGRHNAAMRQLLYHPSPEIMEIYAGEGRVVVPALDYGKTLDQRLETDLTDFVRVRTDTENPLVPKFELVSRLNPFRRLTIKLYCRAGSVGFTQRYVEGDKEEKCSSVVSFQGTTLKLEKEEMIDDLQLIDAITEWLELNPPYRDWCAEGPSPWTKMLENLNAMPTHFTVFLTSLHQQFLRLIPAKTLLSELGYAGVGWRGAGVRRGGAAADKIALPVIIKGRERRTDVNGQYMRMELHWFIQPPGEAPALVVEVNGQGRPIEYSWEENLSAVKLYGLEVQEADLRWRWDDSTKTMVVVFRTRDPD